MLTLSATNPGLAPAAAAGSNSSGNHILFLLVVCGADLDTLEEPRPSGPRYTRDSLRSLLQLLGCKPRLAYKIMLAVFQTVAQAVSNARQQRISRKTFQVHPHRNGKVYVSLTRADFMLLVSTCAAQYSYKISPSSDELKVACSLRERRRCVVVLLSGTSGSGKSTLASILASRLGITTVISTDSIRHMLRSFHSKDAAPLLWASTYQAGEAINPLKGGEEMSDTERTLKGYKAQCELLADQLEVLIAGCEARRQSLICEGVHLNISAVKKLMLRHPDVLPFLVHIASEEKHVERMAVRAKYMTLDPHKNKYVRYMGNIRLIQEYLVRKADKYSIPCVENSNVDRSVGIIHLTIMGCLRRMAKGETVIDPNTGKAHILAAEYSAVLEHLQGEKERLAAKRGALPTSGHLDAAAASSSNQQLLTDLAGASSSSRGNAATAPSHCGTSSQGGEQDPPGCVVASSGDAAVAAGSRRRSIDAPAGSSAVVGNGALARQNSIQLQQPSGQHQQFLTISAPLISATEKLTQDMTSLQLHTVSTHPAVGAAAQLLPNVPRLSSICTSVVMSSAAVNGDVVMSPEGPVMRWEKFLTAGKLSPGDDAQLCESPTSPLAAGGLAMAWPHVRNHQQQQQQQRQQHDIDTLAGAMPGSAPKGSKPVSRVCNGSSAAVGLLIGQHQGVDAVSAADGAEAVADENADGADDRVDLSAETTSINTKQQQLEHVLDEDKGAMASKNSSSTAATAGKDDGLPTAAKPSSFAAAAADTGGADADVSSGEELDELGDLGSSDNEADRFLQEYGSMCESTTCDEHDEDEHDLMGAVGLRAWNGGMARALWPSYHHVYNAAVSNSGGSSSGSMPHYMRSADGSTVQQYPGRSQDQGRFGLSLRMPRQALGMVAEDGPVTGDADAGSSSSSMRPQLSGGSSSFTAGAGSSGVGIGRMTRRAGGGGHSRGMYGSNSLSLRRRGSDTSWLSGDSAAQGSLQQLSELRGPAGGVLSPTARMQQPQVRGVQQIKGQQGQQQQQQQQPPQASDALS